MLKQAVVQVPFAGRVGADQAVPKLFLRVGGGVFEAVHQVQDCDQHIIGQAG